MRARRETDQRVWVNELIKQSIGWDASKATEDRISFHRYVSFSVHWGKRDASRKKRSRRSLAEKKGGQHESSRRAFI